MKTILSFMLFICLLVALTACGGSPKLNEGERYFEGKVDFKYAESCTISYILTPAGKKVRDTKVVIKNMKYNIPSKDGTVRANTGWSSIYCGGGEPDKQGFLELKLKDVTLRFNNISENGADGEMDYRHVEKGDSNRHKKAMNVSIGTFPFKTEDKTASLTAK